MAGGAGCCAATFGVKTPRPGGCPEPCSPGDRRTQTVAEQTAQPVNRTNGCYHFGETLAIRLGPFAAIGELTYNTDIAYTADGVQETAGASRAWHEEQQQSYN